jgi:hypothetical protein
MSFGGHTWHAPTAPTATQGADWQQWAPQTLTRGRKRISLRMQTETLEIRVWDRVNNGATTGALPYSCGCHMSAMLPPINAAPHAPKTPCSARDTTTVCMFGALPMISVCMLWQLYDNLQCVHNLSEKKHSRRHDINRSSAAFLRCRCG